RSARHAAVLARDGSVVVIGGSRGESTVSYSVNRFNPVTETFKRVGSLATGRESHTATPLPDGRILVVGGNSALNERVPAELVDEGTGAVTATGTSVAERRGHAAALLPNGDVLITGGYSNEGHPHGISD